MVKKKYTKQELDSLKVEIENKMFGVINAIHKCNEEKRFDDEAPLRFTNKILEFIKYMVEKENDKT